MNDAVPLDKPAKPNVKKIKIQEKKTVNGVLTNSSFYYNSIFRTIKWVSREALKRHWFGCKSNIFSFP